MCYLTMSIVLQYINPANITLWTVQSGMVSLVVVFRAEEAMCQITVGTLPTSTAVVDGQNHKTLALWKSTLVSP
jgi:hypothetical protein